MAIFTPLEYSCLLANFMSDRDDHTEDEACKFVRWAEQARVDSMLVDAILKGEVKATKMVQEGEFLFESLEPDEQARMRTLYVSLEIDEIFEGPLDGSGGE